MIIVFTKNQTKNKSRDELVEELLNLSDAPSKISDLTEKLNRFVSKYDNLYSEFLILIYYKG